MQPSDRLSDEELLDASKADDAAFAVFYRRYERPVVGYLVGAVGHGEVAADLAAEVFAELVISLDRFDPGVGTASGWLFGIARNVLARSRQRGRVEDRARRRLGLPVMAVTDEQIERIEADFPDSRAVELLWSLPEASAKRSRRGYWWGALIPRSRTSCSAQRASCVSASAVACDHCVS